MINEVKEKLYYIIVSVEGHYSNTFVEDQISLVVSKMRRDIEYSGGVEVDLVGTPICDAGSIGHPDIWRQTVKVTGKGKCIKPWKPK